MRVRKSNVLEKQSFLHYSTLYNFRLSGHMLKQHYLLLCTAWNMAFIASFGWRRNGSCVYLVCCVFFKVTRKRTVSHFAYYTYRIAHTINFSKHSGSQRSISIHFGKMKEQQIFLENYFLSLAEAFDKRFDIGLTSNMPLSAEGQVFFFFVWRSQEKFNRETFNSVMKKEVNSAIPCLKSNRISNLINYFCSQRLSWL